MRPLHLSVFLHKKCLSGAARRFGRRERLRVSLSNLQVHSCKVQTVFVASLSLQSPGSLWRSSNSFCCISFPPIPSFTLPMFKQCLLLLVTPRLRRSAWESSLRLKRLISICEPGVQRFCLEYCLGYCLVYCLRYCPGYCLGYCLRYYLRFCLRYCLGYYGFLLKLLPLC